jgi:hypothetical protein
MTLECGDSCGAGGGGGTPTPSPLPGALSCTAVFTPAGGTVQIGSQFSFTVSVTPENGTVDRVDFSSSNTNMATVSPASDNSVVYLTEATGVSLGTVIITADVVMEGSVTCNVVASLQVTPAGPWWQVKDSDITANGELTSQLLTGEIFGLDGDGSVPGIPMYSGTTNLTTSNISSKGWLVNSSYAGTKTYDYSYFARIVPPDVTFNEITSSSIEGEALSSGGTATDGVYWYRYSGATTGLDLSITYDVALGNRKVILMVDSANLNVQGRITLTDGTGLFAVYVGKTELGTKGDINVDAAIGGAPGGLPQLEGLYLADGAFHTGAGTIQLYIRGSVATYGGMFLERDLVDDAVAPAEYFEYAPDQVMLLPLSLRVKKYKWQEVAP